MKLYENVFIGNFLYALGYSISQKSDDKSFPSVISLLQQTPIDKPLGDLLIEFPGTLRLIESKRKGGSLQKEKEKHHLLSEIVNSERLAKVSVPEMSRSIHSLIEFDSIGNDEHLSVRSVPYLDAFKESSNESHLDFDSFVRSVAAEACSGQSKYDQKMLRAYLDLLFKIEKKYGSIPGYGVGGILLSASSISGVNFIQFDNILELRLQHQQVITEFCKTMDPQVQQARDRGHGRELDLEDDLELSR